MRKLNHYSRRVCLNLMTTWVFFFTSIISGTGKTDTSAVYIKKGTWAETMVATRAKYLQSSSGKKTEPAGTFFRPYDSGLMKGNGPGQCISVNVSGLKTLRLVASCEEGTANCNIWGEPKLITKDGAETRLTALKPASVRVGWGQMLINTNWQGHQLQIGDRKLEYGIWVHANSEIKYDLDGKYERFEAFAGEDKDRANGVLQFKVLSGETIQPPSFWTDISRDYPVQAGWFMKDTGEDGMLDWLSSRTDSKVEQDFINRVLKQIAPGGRGYKDELDNLVKANTVPGNSRWLDLYGRTCRYRECAVALKQTGTDDRANLEKELETMASDRIPPDDSKWQDFRCRIVQSVEIEDQYKTLQNDLKQQAIFDKNANETFRPESLILASDRDPVDVVLRRTTALLTDLKKTGAVDKLAIFEKQLTDLQKKGADIAVTNTNDRCSLFKDVCALRRRIAFSNPLLNFDKILFIKRHRAIFNHMCDQFYGIAATPGGGLYTLDNPFSEKPKVCDMLANSVVKSGRLKGQKLSGGPVQPPQISYNGVGLRSGTESGGGTFLSPNLSYDAKTILFAYVENRGDPSHVWHTDASRGHWDPGRSYHIFKVNVNGSDLVQLTDGTWNDFDPCWLPNGRIAFMTERRGGYLRCGRVCPLYNLYDMAADGSKINALSFHESNEWNPSVTHDGRIVYTRWDYVDRHGCVAHAPWITTLTGSDSRGLHGNFAPRPVRPDMELCVRAIPASHKYVATATPHHGQAYGSLIVIDPRIPDDDAMGPVKRFTPEVAFPESQGGSQVYGTPWPLSENYLLCVYDAKCTRYGIYLVDSFGNKELIYRDPDIACLSPIPLRPTPVPPVCNPPILANAAKLEAVSPGHQGEATMAVVDLYNSIKPWPENITIKELRVLQLLPMSVPSGGPPHQTGKRIAEATDSVVPCRWVLGTVPVEKDGSAHFVVPAYREVFFQALDEKGMAVQSMRSATYARNGERLMCQGCHEPKNRTPNQNKVTPLAMRRPPSVLKPDVSGSNPFSYPLLVQPVLDRNCVACHTKNPGKAPNLGTEPIQNKWYASYNSLINFGFTSYGAIAKNPTVKTSFGYGALSIWMDPRWYRTLPGQFGAYASKLYEMLSKGHHDVKLSAEDMHRITLWLDCSSLFYGVFEKEGGEAQLRGEIVKATLE
ncbi:MAG: NPCBM/NEW2 domain-containing protein [Kiritimatiellae bacterium]|nr:NPCBM/NEW2 domain-containing protein [Kiritimatiellia bacterium]MDD5522409.1 NPCBM/NEW2 domain-containing protein [Kiritimatiellia bacterium]